jgi:hypothetical protein
MSGNLKPFWSSTQRGEHDTGYMPTVAKKSHTLIMALTFPTSNQDGYISYNDRQWILVYGQLESDSQYGSSTYDESSATYIDPRWDIGVWDGIQVRDMKMDEGKDEIQAGKVLTLCAVVDPDGQYILYLNGTRPQSGITNYGSDADTVRTDFQYRSSSIRIGSGSRERDFQGIIHETRLYDYSLTSQQVQDVTDELYALHSRPAESALPELMF